VGQLSSRICLGRFWRQAETVAIGSLDFIVGSGKLSGDHTGRAAARGVQGCGRSVVQGIHVGSGRHQSLHGGYRCHLPVGAVVAGLIAAEVACHAGVFDEPSPALLTAEMADDLLAAGQGAISGTASHSPLPCLLLKILTETRWPARMGRSPVSANVGAATGVCGGALLPRS
jgi:hypothetical protein